MSDNPIRVAYDRMVAATAEAISQGSEQVTLNATDVALVVANMRFIMADDEQSEEENPQPVSTYFAD